MACFLSGNASLTHSSEGDWAAVVDLLTARSGVYHPAACESGGLVIVLATDTRTKALKLHLLMDAPPKGSTGPSGSEQGRHA